MSAALEFLRLALGRIVSVWVSANVKYGAPASPQISLRVIAKDTVPQITEPIVTPVKAYHFTVV